MGSCAFARHYWRNHCCFLFLRVLRCFSSPGLPPARAGYRAFSTVGCPIRAPADRPLFAGPRRFSQLTAPFFASESLGIPHTPFLTSFLRHARERAASYDSFSSMSMNTLPKSPPLSLGCPSDRPGTGNAVDLAPRPGAAAPGAPLPVQILYLFQSCLPVPILPVPILSIPIPPIPASFLSSPQALAPCGEYRIRTDDPLLAKQVL